MNEAREPEPGPPGDPPSISVVVGGPWYGLYLRTRLARPSLSLLPRRLFIIPLLCWLPLLGLSALAGRLTKGATGAFLFDPEVHVRLLLALPLLIASEVYVHERIRWIVAQFTARGLIAPPEQPRYGQILASAIRLRDSWKMELALLVLAGPVGYWSWRHWLTLAVSSWYANVSGTTQHLTPAGMYYAFFSLVVLRFLFYRWYFRLFVWYRLLWQIHSLPLQLNLYHPDRSGGLGFLSESLPAFAPLFAAQSLTFAGYVYSRILYAGKSLPNFTTDIAVVLVCFAAVAAGPTFFFIGRLEFACRQAQYEFGALASRYVNDFRGKWVVAGPPPGEPLLGTADLQSLSDLDHAYAVVREMRWVPIANDSLFIFLLLIVIPFLPLVLTMVPMSEALRNLWRVVL